MCDYSPAIEDKPSSGSARIALYPALFSATSSTFLSAAFCAGTFPNLLISILWFLGSPLNPTYQTVDRAPVSASL